MIVLPARCKPKPGVNSEPLRPRLISFSNQRVLMRVKALSDRSRPFKCVKVSNTRPGMPVSVRLLPASCSELPVVAVTAATPANRSAGSDTSSFWLRSSQRNGKPWNRRGGSDSSALPERSKCVAFVRYAKSSQSSDVIFGDSGNVLSGRRLKGCEALVTTRSVRFVILTACVSDGDAHGESAVTAAGVAVTPLRRTLSFRCLMISFATARLRLQRLTVSVPDWLLSSASVPS